MSRRCFLNIGGNDYTHVNKMADIPTRFTQEFKPGEIALLDGEREVIVLEQTSDRISTKIFGIKKAGGAKNLYKVLTYRLSKKQ